MAYIIICGAPIIIHTYSVLHCSFLLFAGAHVQLQTKLLDESCRALKPEPDFLATLSGVVSSRWHSLAASLSLNVAEMEEVRKRGENQTPRDQALRLLEVWALRADATYSQLLHILTSPLSLSMLTTM